MKKPVLIKIKQKDFSLKNYKAKVRRKTKISAVPQRRKIKMKKMSMNRLIDYLWQLIN